MIKALFELAVKKQWLKAIEKEVRKYNRINEKLRVQAYAVNALLKRYKEIYGEDLRVVRKEANA